MYGLSSALIGVVCFVTCKLHAIFSGNSFTKSRIFFWNVKHIWSHYNFKKSKQMCTTTDAEPRLPFSTRRCSCSLLTEILFAAEQARALRVLRLFGFNWNLNTMLTSILRTLREFILFFPFFPFSQAWAIKQQFHWPQFCLFNCYCSFVHPCSCKAIRWKPSPSHALSFHRCSWWGFMYPAGSQAHTCHLLLKHMSPLVLLSLYSPRSMATFLSTHLQMQAHRTCPYPIMALGASSTPAVVIVPVRCVG